MKISCMSRILKFLERMEYRVLYKDESTGIMKVSNEKDGIGHLIIGVVPPVLIFEYYLFTVKNESVSLFKKLLQKNRDIIHGAFVLNEDGSKVLYRYSIQVENVDFNEFESAVNALGFLLNEYAEQLIQFSKQ